MHKQGEAISNVANYSKRSAFRPLRQVTNIYFYTLKRIYSYYLACIGTGDVIKKSFSRPKVGRLTPNQKMNVSELGNEVPNQQLGV
jgi:hypothetical protein